MLFIFVIIKQTIEQTLTRHVINIVWALKFCDIRPLKFFSSHVYNLLHHKIDMSHVIMPIK